MRDLIVNLIKEGAKEMYDIHGHVYPWRLGRNLGISVEVVEGHLIKLGRAKSVLILEEAGDLKSHVGYPTCRFESGPRHHFLFLIPLKNVS